jgi:hypothetical protein
MTFDIPPLPFGSRWGRIRRELQCERATTVAVVLDRDGHLFPEGEEKLAERLDVVFRAASPPKRIVPPPPKGLPPAKEENHLAK